MAHDWAGWVSKNFLWIFWNSVLKIEQYITESRPSSNQERENSRNFILEFFLGTQSWAWSFSQSISIVRPMVLEYRCVVVCENSRKIRWSFWEISLKTLGILYSHTPEWAIMRFMVPSMRHKWALFHLNETWNFTEFFRNVAGFCWPYKGQSGKLRKAVFRLAHAVTGENFLGTFSV